MAQKALWERCYLALLGERQLPKAAKYGDVELALIEIKNDVLCGWVTTQHVTRLNTHLKIMVKKFRCLELVDAIEQAVREVEGKITTLPGNETLAG